MLKEYLLSKTFFIRFIIFIVLFSHFIFGVQNFSFFLESMRLGFGFFYSYGELFDISSTFNIFTFNIAAITIILSAYNFALIIEFLRQQKKILQGGNKIDKKTSSVFSLSFVLAIIGTHCASCGAALFGGLLSLTGLSVLPFAGKEIGVIAIMLLIWSTYSISKKVNSPYTC